MTRCLLVPIAFLISHAAFAASDEDLAESDRIAELERKVDVLATELERTRSEMALPADEELEGFHGMGPGASKVYGLARGLSIGGYAEGLWTAVIDDKRKSGERNRGDFQRAVLYVGYKFTDKFVYNMELEFEHATTSSTRSSGDGSVSVEFAALDYLHSDELNARAGLLLMPIGFLNEVHEPPFYYGTHRPDVERLIIPSTWRELGAGFYGRIADIVEYKLYAVTSMNAAGFTSSGLRGGRQQGNRPLAEDMAFIGRLDVEPIPELQLGGSVFVGNTGQDQDFGLAGGGQVGLPDARLALWEIHGQFESHGFHARALFTAAYLDDAGALTRSLGPTAGGGTGTLDANANGVIDTGEVVAERMLGVYGEVGYEILQWLAPDSGQTLEPFVRIEYVDTQNDLPKGFSADTRRKFQVYTLGLHYKPIPNVVLKADYRNRVARRGALGDEFNLGIGVVF